VARVPTKFIADSAVTAAKIATDAVTTVKILNANVTNVKIAAGVDAVKIADGSVSNAEFQTLDGAQSSLQAQIDQDSLIKGDNRNFEATVGAWLAYADAAQATPVDGTGGSPVLTVTRTTTTPLNGVASLLLTKDAANRQGNGGSVLLDVAPAYRGKPLKLQFAYEASANFSYANQASDVQVFIYDVTNAQVLQPNSIFLDGSGFYSGSIQLPTNTAQIRVILHVATVSALAWTLEADDFNLTLNQNEFVNSDSDWVAYTPVLQGFGTITSPEIYWRQNGPDVEIQAKFTCGTVTASEAQFGLPPGLRVSSIITSVQAVGEYTLKATTTGNFNRAVLATANDTFLNFGITSSVNDGLTELAGNVAFSNSIVVSFFARVPAAGLTSGYAHPAAIGLNAQVVMRAFKNGGAVTATTVIPSWTTVSKDSVSAFNATTGVYTVRTPGDYFVNFTARLTADSAAYGRIYVNGVTIATGASILSSSSHNVATLLTNLNYGDTIDVRLNASATIASDTVGTILSIHKLGSEAQPYAPRIAYIEDLKAANTSGGTFTSGAWQTRTLNTLTGDASFITLASNQFTLQPGTYHIEATAPGYRVSRHKAKLRQTSGTPADIIIGSSEYSDSTNLVASSSRIQRVISISVATTYEIQHQAQVTQTTFGFGVESNFAVSEIYTQVKITKVL
jgi:hypothetical protein